MERIDFNTNWEFKKLHQEEGEVKINLPHDAMLYECRQETNPGGGNISYFEGGDYRYSKIFAVPEDYRSKNVIFEFEGVYRNAEVFINHEKAGFHPYGYTNFYIDANPYLKFGEENEIQVLARNADQPNSRWYSGAGIYRPVHMYVADKEHILLNGIKINTLSLQPAVISIDVKTTCGGEVKVEIYDENILVSSVVMDTNGKTNVKVDIPNAKIWDCEHPNLYQCKVSYGTDIVEETFGIRMLNWDSKGGFRINNKRVILRGACIHHDNGLLGACCYPEAEERKVKILLENGYNAIRSAHNPCSKALLDACDRLGMLVMDEYVDVWYIHKTEYDYANYMADWWQEDLKDMVDKDYNHPSVIMYSTGNEVSETAQEQGIKLTGQMTEYLHRLDASRPVTCGVNIFFNYLSSIGFGVYSDEKAKKNAEKALIDSENNFKGRKKNKPVGSEFYNMLAGLLGDKAMKIGATLHGCDVRTRDAYANMDIAGYNYGILRYKKDLIKYPNRLILGSETFCNDAYTFWELAKRNPRIIGDFVWSGIDYLGEAGIGSWVYEDYAPKNEPRSGWLTAGSGRIDITGKPSGEAAYTRIAFECTDQPIIAVRPVKENSKHSPSAWKMTDAMESWSWEENKGGKAIVEVYARAHVVELFINNKFVGKKIVKNDCRVQFRAKYQAGEITAITYNTEGKKIASTSLLTAGNETILRAIAEEKSVKESGLCYVKIQYTDQKGTLKPTARNVIHVKVTGGTLLGLGNACSFNKEGYLNDFTETYYGEALAIVKAGNAEVLEVSITDGINNDYVKVPIIKCN